MSRAASLDLAIMTEVDLPALGEIIRTEASIRAAVGRLSNPRQRIQERLFWFHGSVLLENTPLLEQPRVSPRSLSPAERAHDNALRKLIAAYMVGPGETIGIITALRQWHELVSAPEYWELLTTIESKGGFEPAAIASEIDSLRAEAVALAAEPFEIAARDAWVRKDLEGLRRYIAALGDLEDTGRWTEFSKQSLISPLIDQLGNACNTLKDKYRSQMVYEDDAAKRNKNVCIGELQFYRDFIEPAWKYIAATLPDDDQESRIARGQIADCLSNIATDHTWANDLALRMRIS